MIRFALAFMLMHIGSAEHFASSSDVFTLRPRARHQLCMRGSSDELPNAHVEESDARARSFPRTWKKDSDSAQYLLIYEKTQDQGFQKLKNTNELEELCAELFVGGVPMVWHSPEKQDSKPICIVIQEGDKKVPLYWSDYNEKRKIPNFVAFRALGKAAAVHGVERKFKLLCRLVNRATCQDKDEVDDGMYFTGDMTPSGSCKDDDCKAPVGSRGHMAPLSTMAWSLLSARATNLMINTVPTRQPFDGSTWSKREEGIRNFSSRKELPIFVVVGPSVESDGVIMGAEVPSNLWTAVYDPLTQSSTAWVCRNGLTPAVPCFCADDVSLEDLEQYVGLKMWPGAEKKNHMVERVYAPDENACLLYCKA